MPFPTRPADDLPFHVGDRLTDFASVDLTAHRVASGGFGVVALGPNLRTGGEWRALKTLRRHFLANPKVRELFVRECLTWKGLWPHANVLTAQYVTEVNSLPVLVLDYATHGSLRDVFEGGWLRWQTSLDLAQQVLAGLVYLHTPDPAFLRPDPIVHRDLKPENVLLDEEGFALITDFGLAKVVAEDLGADLDSVVDTGDGSSTAGVTQAYQTSRGKALGTPAYMAPEQWEDAALAGTSADIYAVGLLMVELLTGQHPLFPLNERHRHQEWRQAHQEAASRLPALETLTTADVWAAWPTGLAAGVAVVARQCLARVPEERPNAQQALIAMQQLATQLAESAYTSPEVVAHTSEQEMIFWEGWGDAYSSFGRYQEALVRNNRAIALDPHDPVVLLGRGNILRRLRRYAEAEAAYQHALTLRPSEDTERDSFVWNMLGTSRSEQGQYAEAELAYAKAVAFYPGNAGAWFNRANNAGFLAQMEAQAGRITQARALCTEGVTWATESLRLRPQDTNTHNLLAMLQELAARLETGMS